MKILLLAFVLANYFSFFYSTVRVFSSHPEKRTLHLRLLQIVTLALWVAGPIVIYHSAPSWHHWIILAIQLICLAGFWSTSNIAKRNRFTAVFSNDAPVTLVRSGLYRYVRHPFYCIYLTCYGSIALVEFSLPYTALFVAIACIYVYAARVEEAKFRASGLSDEHVRYTEQTGMFFPRLRR